MLIAVLAVVLEIERIVEAIAGLPNEQRTMLVLRDIHGLSGSATAPEPGSTSIGAEDSSRAG